MTINLCLSEFIIGERVNEVDSVTLTEDPSNDENAEVTSELVQSSSGLFTVNIFWHYLPFTSGVQKPQALPNADSRVEVSCVVDPTSFNLLNFVFIFRRQVKRRYRIQHVRAKRQRKIRRRRPRSWRNRWKSPLSKLVMRKRYLIITFPIRNFRLEVFFIWFSFSVSFLFFKIINWLILMFLTLLNRSRQRIKLRPRLNVRNSSPGSWLFLEVSYFLAPFTFLLSGFKPKLLSTKLFVPLFLFICVFFFQVLPFWTGSFGFTILFLPCMLLYS